MCVLWVRVRVRVRVRSLLYTPLWGFWAIQDKAIIYYQVYIKNIYLKKKKIPEFPYDTIPMIFLLSENWPTVWLTEYLTLLSGDWPTDWMIYGWLIDRITDATVRTDHWSKLFMAGWLTDWLTFCTVWRLTNWLNGLWLVDWLTNWCYCLTTNQHGEWFIVGWLTE